MLFRRAFSETLAPTKRWFHPPERRRTTGGSQSLEYLYGLSAVYAALVSNRRRLVKLYRQHSNDILAKKNTLADKILALADEKKVPQEYVSKERLNDLCFQRPHQGLVLRATPYPLANIKELGNWSATHPTYTVHCTQGEPRRHSTAGKAPRWLALDQLTDPQNVGSIVRSAYYFGVSGIVLCSKNSSKLSPVVAKASSGALECMDVYQSTGLTKFLDRCHQRGWTVLGATVPDSTEPNPALLPLHSLSTLSKAPVILVVGSEGQGLRSAVKSACQQIVSIPSTNPSVQPFVDSLNVGVATGILLQGLSDAEGS
ncbi:hypothetical protein IWQ62_001526 [Dispira parvispora]|uniref:rRNA methyltransferase 1, mitochondrial n=1 Tax=Dispira parvispora TaxID=1520584 RepID=A0A9W8AUU0_9FUNG|nr:hypothetical protein IWQ62_001526 [Dispira parvispora]